MRLNFLFVTTLFASVKANELIVPSSSVSEQVQDAFDNAYENVIKPHPGSNHPLFDNIAEMAVTEGLTSRQFELFRDAMFTRVFTTIPSIFELGKQAMLKGDILTAATAIRNLMEEGGEGTPAMMHPRMMEEAFNTLGKEVFGLRPVTMRECYEQSIQDTALIYRAAVRDFYEKQGPLVSYAQEFASGGNDSAENPGMMGNMYKLFYHYRNMLPEGVFEQKIKPYFAAHITINEATNEQVFEGNAIEFQHGERALRDVLRQLKTQEDVNRAIAYMQAFLKVQHQFFNTILEQVGEARTVGQPIVATGHENNERATNLEYTNIVHLQPRPKQSYVEQLQERRSKGSLAYER